jgi:hypothetical protein
MKVLPHKRSRSRKVAIASTRRSALGPKKCQVKCQVQPPDIFVRVPSDGWSTHKYMAAKIRVRRGCYRYLTWRDGLFKREFYLGKIKICAPRFSREASAPAPGAGQVDILRAGVQK